MRVIGFLLLHLVSVVKAQAIDETDPPIDNDRRLEGESCCSLGNPVELAFLYTGDGCLVAENNGQTGDNCIGTISPADPPEKVFILASSREDPCDPDADVWFEDERTLSNPEFTLTTNEASFPTEVFIHILPADSLCDAERLETIKFIADCSEGEKIDMGSIFGSVEVSGCFAVESDQGEDCCEFLDDEPLQLRFTYTGETAVKIIANDRADACDTNKVWYSAHVVEPQDEFTLDVHTIGENSFGSAIFFHLLDENASCNSKSSTETYEIDICSRNSKTNVRDGDGLIIGDPVPRAGKTILIGCSAESPTVEKSCCQPTQSLASLHFTYNGGNCQNDLAESIVESCTGELNDAQAVHIVASASEDVCDPNANIYFDDNVDLGSEFVLKGNGNDQSEIIGDVWLHYMPLDFDRASETCNNDLIMQRVKFQISCTDSDIITNRLFGGSKLSECHAISSDDCCASDVAPLFLTFELSPRSCSTSKNGQLHDYCTGTVSEREVYVVANGDESVCKNSDWNGPVWYEGFLSITNSDSELITLSVANEFGQTAFADFTYIHILEKDAVCVGNELKKSDHLLQQIRIQTTCSSNEPLFLGDIFASATLVDCKADFEDDCCDSNKKPRQITFEYIPRNCSYFGNEQVSYANRINQVCTDFINTANSKEDVFIIASDNDQPCEQTAKKWFSDIVTFGETSKEFTVHTDSTFSPNTYIHILSKTDVPCTNGELTPGVHQIQKLYFDAQCDEPLKIGNFFGSTEVIDCQSIHQIIPASSASSGEELSAEK
uniref:DUF7467 domain-containing protein n=1 Tax=Aureoumbra lagunensis TaxID=44058 RepID=A0A7S3JUV1_9STRA